MNICNVDYIGIYFEYPVLTQITGTPTYNGLKQLKNELKTNAVGVQSNLAGGGKCPSRPSSYGYGIRFSKDNAIS